MTTTNTFDRQPTKLDYASPTQFRFSIIKLPKVEYFTTTVNIPGVNLGVAEMPTPLKDIPIPGDKLTYASLDLTFLVDENLENYRELHGWLTGLGFNWGGFTGDMTVSDNIFGDPVGYMTGNQQHGALSSNVTLTYSF